MNKLNELKNRKLDNKGFSLVELIIVIAIMAVLIGVLAPQYLKYVEKSRVSTDGDNAVAIQSALQVYASDPEAASTLANGDKVEITPTGTTPNTSSASGAVVDALKNAGIDTSKLKLTNKNTYSKITIQVTIDATGGTQVTVDNTAITP